MLVRLHVHHEPFDRDSLFLLSLACAALVFFSRLCRVMVSLQLMGQQLHTT